MHALASLLKQHRSLLADEVRMSAFAAAIASSVQPGDVVLDVGSGTGILAMLAVRAGARRVFAIEREHTIDAAALLARQNGLQVEWFHRGSTEVELPERATLLITETLGNLGFDEGILGSVLDARTRLLASGARIIPQSVALMAAPVEAPELFEKRIGWWSGRRQDLDLSPMRTFASNQIWNAEFAPESLLAAPAILQDLALGSIESTMVRGSAAFEMTRDAVVHGFGAWFSTQLTAEVALSNAPPLQTPNWSQGFLPLENPVTVCAGAKVTLEVESDDGMQWRWRGSIASDQLIRFDQMTQFGFAPCISQRP